MLLLLAALPPARAADRVDPAADQHAFQAYFRHAFPNVPLNDFANGPYAVDQGMRKQWEEIMQFPPYDFALADGKKLFETPFKNGKTYADCFPNGGIGIRQNYPYFDSKTGEVITLDLAINQCREENGEKPLEYQVGAMAAIDAYMSYDLARQAVRHQDPERPGRPGGIPGRQEFFLRAPRPTELLVCQLSCQVGGQAPARRRFGAGARHIGRVSDLSL